MQHVAPRADPIEVPQISNTLESEDHTIPAVSTIIIFEDNFYCSHCVYQTN
jgi:hypothetical protein